MKNFKIILFSLSCGIFTCASFQQPIMAMTKSADTIESTTKPKKKSKIKLSQSQLMESALLGAAKNNKKKITLTINGKKVTLTINELLSEAIDLNAQTIDKTGHTGYTALHWAVHNGNCDLAESLILHGADLEIENYAGETPLLLAVKEDKTENNLSIVTLMLGYHAYVNTQDDTGKTPLHYAIENSGLDADNLDMVELLVDNCARLDIKDNNGDSPLSLAKDKGPQETYEYLRKIAREEKDIPLRSLSTIPLPRADKTFPDPEFSKSIKVPEPLMKEMLAAEAEIAAISHRNTL